MDRYPGRRKWVPMLGALAVAGCGGGDDPAPAKTTSTYTITDLNLARRCGAKPAGGDGGFPPGLLLRGNVVTGEGVAILDGTLADVFAELKAAKGFEVRDSELETLDAELELEGPGGEVSLQLELAPDCKRATRVTLR